MTHDPDVLHGLGAGELEALADGLLAPSLQARADLQRVAPARWGNCCAYCHTAEAGCGLP